MGTLALGVFTDQTRAETAINALQDAGHSPSEISIIMQDKGQAKSVAENTGATVASSTVSGATTGGVIGGVAGLLIGIGAITIPGIGALLIGGPVAAALGLSGAAATTATGAMTGAVAGGLVGALSGLGVSAADAAHYQERVKSGAILLAVPQNNMEGTSAESLLAANGAEDIRVIATDKM